jgi:hypothetical protein
MDALPIYLNSLIPQSIAKWTTVTAANCGWRGWKTVPPKEIAEAIVRFVAR